MLKSGHMIKTIKYTVAGTIISVGVSNYLWFPNNAEYCQYFTPVCEEFLTTRTVEYLFNPTGDLTRITAVTSSTASASVSPTLPQNSW